MAAPRRSRLAAFLPPRWGRGGVARRPGAGEGSVAPRALCHARPSLCLTPGKAGGPRDEGLEDTQFTGTLAWRDVV